MINGKPEEKQPVPPPVTPPVDATTPPVVVAPTAMPVPVAEKHAVTLDELLALVHADSTSEFALVRSPASLLDLGDEAFKFYDGPVQSMVALLGQQELATGFAAAKAGLADARAQLASSGIDLTRGLVVTQTGKDSASAVFLVAADKAEGVKGLLTAMKVKDADKTVCKPIAAALLLELERMSDKTRFRLTADSWLAVVHGVHRTIGVAVAEKWRLPESVAQAIRDSGEYDVAERQSLAKGSSSASAPASHSASTRSASIVRCW